MFITFIYRVEKITKHIMCFNYISDNHEGLDNEIKYILEQTLIKYKKNNIHKLKLMIGVLSSNKTIPTYSTNN